MGRFPGGGDPDAGVIFDDHECAVSDGVSTVALLWNINGCSELQILQAADNSLSEPIALPNLVARELSAGE